MLLQAVLLLQYALPLPGQAFVRHNVLRSTVAARGGPSGRNTSGLDSLVEVDEPRGADDDDDDDDDDNNKPKRYAVCCDVAFTGAPCWTDDGVLI